MNYFLGPLKKYAIFSGRASRREYAGFLISLIVIGILLGLIEGALNIAPESSHSVLANLFSLAVLLPWLAISVRRLHDLNKSGYWVLVFFVPIVGQIVILVLMLIRGDTTENAHGDPNEA